MPRTELCRLEVDGPVARLNLTRTQVHNALNIQLISEITDVLEWAAVRSVGSTGELHGSDGSQNLRVLVISSEGRHFCAGADINMMREGGKKSAEDNRSDAELLDCLFTGSGPTLVSPSPPCTASPSEEVLVLSPAATTR